MSPSELEEFEFRARAEEEEALAAQQESSAAMNFAKQAAEVAGPQLASGARTAIGNVNPADLAAVARPGIDAAKAVGGAAKGIVSYPIDVAKNAMSWTPRSIMEVAAHPGIAMQQYIENHPLAKSNASLNSLAGDAAQYAKTTGAGMVAGAKNLGARVGSGLVQGALAPESSFLLPYQMAAYEQEKIRANPTAPEYANNPYAQTVRGEAPTQAAAGAANAQRALIGQQYGGLTPEEQAIMAQERQRQMKQAQARQVLKQPPTSQNFIERSKALADLYGTQR